MLAAAQENDKFQYQDSKFLQNFLGFFRGNIIKSRCHLSSYGVYFIPFALISIFILIPPRYKKPLFIILLICALNFGIKNSISLASKNIKIKTERGVVYTSEPSVKETIDYVNDNTALTDRVVVYPECLAVNFMTGRVSDNKFYSLIPLYVETFGEENIIKRIRLTKPDFIIITDYNTFAYGYSKFGTNYAIKFKNYIDENYTRTDESSTFIIYKKLHMISQLFRIINTSTC